MWVAGINLSRGVLSNHKAGLALPRNAKANVDRGYAEQQKSFFNKHAKSLRLGKKKARSANPVSVASKCEKWCAKAQSYVVAINTILSSPVKARAALREKILSQMGELSLHCVENFAMEHFLSGRLVKWDKKALTPSKNQTGAIYCHACKKEFKFPQWNRVLYHVSCQEHHDCCRVKNQAGATDRSAAALKEECATTICKFTLLIMYIF